MASRTISILVGREPRAFTRSVSDTVPVIDSRTVSLTAGPEVEDVYWGYAPQASNNTEYQRTRDVLGRPQVLRWYSDDGALTYPSGHADYTNLPVWFSWKPVYATLMAGGYDAAMTSWLNARSTTYPTWWSTWHEPDVKSMSTAQSKAMTEYVGNFIHAYGNPMIRSVLCVGGYPMTGSNAAYLYIPDDVSTIDVYAADPYASGQSSANRLTYSGGRAVVRRYLTDVANDYLPASMRIGIGEVGNAVTNGTDAQRRDWYRGFHDEMAEDPRTEVVALFHRGGIRFYDPSNPSNVTSPLSAAYWASLMAA